MEAKKVPFWKSWRSSSRQRHLPIDSSNSNSEGSTHQSNSSTIQPYANQNDSAFAANEQLSVAPPTTHAQSGNPILKGKDKYGLHTIHDGTKTPAGAFKGRQYPIDIVAVHGLNGDAFETWTADHTINGRKERVNWLRDFLPEEFPGSRIFTFGYPAEIFFSRSIGDIHSYARDLMYYLLNERSDREHKRPIIFICHSMGGIIVKKGLNLCVFEGGEYLELREAVKSIMFFATPHGGSAIASLASDLARITNFVTLGTGAIKSNALKSLERDSTVLYEIATDFRKLAPNYQIYNFQEMNKEKYLNRVLVSQADASMGTPTEMLIPMSGYDHRSIVRFGHREEQGYKLVKGTLRRAINDATSLFIQQIKSEDEPCLQSLSFPSLQARLDNIELRARGYMSPWVTSHQKYQAWLSSTQGLLWIKGHPGTGKSTLMASIQHELQDPLYWRSACISFFFDRGGTTLQKSQLGMFRSLLKQIYRRSIPAREMILKIFEEKKKSFGEPGKDWEWQLSEVEALFFDVVVEASQQTEVIILVDALDEAEDQDEENGNPAHRLVSYFHRLNAKIEEHQGRTKICISCRHYPNINTGKALEIVVEEENEEALRDFVIQELCSHVLDWLDQPEELQDNLVRMVVTKADRQFLWASIRVPMVVNSLNDGTHSFETIYEVLESESSRLSDLYKSILTANIDVRVREKAFTLLQWVLLAKRPLSLTELRFAMVCGDDVFVAGMESCDQVKEFVEGDIRMEKLVRSLSGGLAVITRHGKNAGDTTVRFVHQTVYEYLWTQGLKSLFSSDSKSTITGNNEFLGSCEERLSRACVNYWTSLQVLSAIEQWERGDEKNLPFIVYSVNYWTTHASKAEGSGRSQVDLVRIFDARQGSLDAYRMISAKLGGWADFTTSHCLLHIASCSNLTSVVEYLLNYGISANTLDVDRTPLQFAAKWGHVKVVDMLLDAGATIGTQDWNRRTALELAASNSQGHVVKRLLERGAEINGASSFGGVLHTAAANGNLNLLKFLISNGAEVNCKAGDGGTALQAAARKCHQHIAQFLVENGADINANEGPYGSPLQAACRWVVDEKDEQLVYYLLGVGADVNIRGGPADSALKAAIAGPAPISVVEALLAKGADIHFEGGQHGTALQAAARKGADDITRLLLDLGAEPNQQGGEDGSALHAAAASAWGEPVVRMLITAGADINIQSPAWGSVLQSAAYSGTEAVAGYFLDLGVDVNTQGGDHGNALFAAISGERGLPMAELLIEHGADVNSQGVCFGSPLEAAIYQNRPAIFRLLLERGAEVHQNQSPTGEPPLFLLGNYRTLLQIAAIQGQLEMAKVLLELGLDINACGLRYGNVLEAAVKTNRVEMVHFLFERSARADLAMINGLLYVAKGKKEMTRVLLERKNQHFKD